MRDEILKLLKESEVPLTELNIQDKLSEKVSLDKLCEELRTMEKCGDLYVTKKGKYTVYENTHLKVGKLSVSKKGFGFVIMENEPDIHIKKENMNGAIHNDLVACEYISEEEGRIVKIIDRSFDTIIGEYTIDTDNKGKIILDDTRMKIDIIIDEKNRNGAMPGHKVIVKPYTQIGNNKYYGEVDKKELTSAAIKGMMNYLSDDYSMYFTEDEKNDFNERLNGVYTGLGVEITNDASNNAMIVTVFDNSSAKDANLKPGDIIAKINGEDVLGLGKEEVVKKIKGKNNYSFNMSVLRDNNLIDVKVVTKSITLSSVTSSVIEKDNEKIGYIYISIFALNTYDQFKKQLEELEKMKITSLIIDVRSNTGGHLTSVTSILDLFLNKTDVLYQIKSKDKIKKVYGTETSTRKYPIVVLTNELSASASEILASALKEAYGAKTVGIKTFGKGTMQNMLDLENGGMIKVTTEEWLTSKGNKINKEGVPVDYEVKLDEKYASNPSKETDNQLQKAIEVLTKANN